MKLKFWYIDVFTAKKFSGNPAAVFFESDGLDEKIMQKIANELNISETVFLQKTSKKADYKARIFTPKRELPFAGHPTIAASFAFKKFYGISKEKLIQECGAGLIEIEQKDSVFFVRQNDPQFAEISLSKKAAAEMFGVSVDEVSDLSFMKISTGIWWGVFMLNSSKAVSRAAPNYEQIIKLSQKENLVGVQIFAKTKENPEIHVRTFAPICGVFEDPVCGSGNGCVASYIAKNNLLEKSNYIVTQGSEVGREGRVYASFEKVGEEIKNIKIGGEAIKVLEGEIEI
jgi:PhzF family phenazine biosynthesis protein